MNQFIIYRPDSREFLDGSERAWTHDVDAAAVFTSAELAVAIGEREGYAFRCFQIVTG